MRRIEVSTSIFFSLCASLLAVTPLTAQDARISSSRSAAAGYFTDTVLIDQDGAKHRFYSDLIKDKVVIINVMFAACDGSCPIMADRLARIQKWLGPRLGADTTMVSISNDPADTPEKLKAYGARFNAKHGWYFLTGNQSDVNFILGKLGLYTEVKQDHQNVFLIGNDRTGLWKKALGISDAESLIKIVESVLRDRPPAAGNLY